MEVIAYQEGAGSLRSRSARVEANPCASWESRCRIWSSARIWSCESAMTIRCEQRRSGNGKEQEEEEARGSAARLRWTLDLHEPCAFHVNVGDFKTCLSCPGSRPHSATVKRIRHKLPDSPGILAATMMWRDTTSVVQCWTLTSSSTTAGPKSTYLTPQCMLLLVHPSCQ